MYLEVSQSFHFLSVSFIIRLWKGCYSDDRFLFLLEGVIVLSRVFSPHFDILTLLKNCFPSSLRGGEMQKYPTERTLLSSIHSNTILLCGNKHLVWCDNMLKKQVAAATIKKT